jgi:hypothetical protein
VNLDLKLFVSLLPYNIFPFEIVLSLFVDNTDHKLVSEVLYFEVTKCASFEIYAIQVVIINISFFSDPLFNTS